MHRHASEGLVILRGLWKSRLVICVCLSVSLFAALGYSLKQTKQYTATASLLFRDTAFGQELFGAQVFAPSTDRTREAATNLRLVSLDAVGRRTARRVPASGAVMDHVEIEGQGQADIVAVSATYTDPQMAARVANAFVSEFIDYRREADRKKIAGAQALLRQRLRSSNGGTQGNGLERRIEQLDVLASLQTGNAEVAEAAQVPSSPSSPHVVANTVIGGFLGLLVGILVALLRSRLDRRLGDASELQEIFDRPLVGAIPASRALAQTDFAKGGLTASDREAFRMLRANLRYFNIDRAIRSVLVTSAAPQDGKSTVCWNLATIIASSGSSALLIEADLRHPTLALRVGAPGHHGLSTVLAGDTTLEQATRHLPLNPSSSSSPSLAVLFAGPQPPNPADLLESDRMRDVLAVAQTIYDFVIVDTPPTTVIADAIPLFGQVGGVLVVGRIGKTSRTALALLRDQLRNLDVPVLGLVANGADSDSFVYGYGYDTAIDNGTAAPRADDRVNAKVSPR